MLENLHYIRGTLVGQLLRATANKSLYLRTQETFNFDMPAFVTTTNDSEP